TLDQRRLTTASPLMERALPPQAARKPLVNTAPPAALTVRRKVRRFTGIALWKLGGRIALGMFAFLIASVSHSQEIQGFIQPHDQPLIFLHVLACERQSQEGTDEIGDIVLRDVVGVIS